MAYLSKNISVLAYANGFTLWHYSSEDTAAEILADSYFDDAANLLRRGDLIVMNTDTEGSPETRVSAVRAIAAGAVTLGNEPNKASFVANASGGATVDRECRAQIAALINALVAAGQMEAS